MAVLDTTPFAVKAAQAFGLMRGGATFAKGLYYIAWLRARGIMKLQLMVRGDNAKVHAFYESIGYYDQKRTTFAKWLDGRDPTP